MNHDKPLCTTLSPLYFVSLNLSLLLERLQNVSRAGSRIRRVSIRCQPLQCLWVYSQLASRSTSEPSTDLSASEFLTSPNSSFTTDSIHTLDISKAFTLLGRTYGSVLQIVKEIQFGLLRLPQYPGTMYLIYAANPVSYSHEEDRICLLQALDNEI